MQRQVNEWSITQINIKGSGCYERKAWRAVKALKRKWLRVGRMIMVVARRQKRSGFKACWWHKMNGTCWCTWYGGWERAQIGRWASFPQPSKLDILFSSVQFKMRECFPSCLLAICGEKLQNSKHDFLNSEISLSDNREIRVFIFVISTGINWQQSLMLFSTLSPLISWYFYKVSMARFPWHHNSLFHPFCQKKKKKKTFLYLNECAYSLSLRDTHTVVLAEN